MTAPELMTVDALRAQAVSAWAASLGAAPVADDESFFEAGGDSLTAVALAGELAKRVGVDLDLAAFYTDPTIGGLVAQLVVDTDGVPTVHHTTGRTIVRMRRSGEGRLWVFLPPLSGAVTRYASMARLLPIGDAVWACETPAAHSGRGLAALTRGIAAELAQAGAGGFDSACLSGYSLGGVLALEVARALREDAAWRVALDVLMIDPPPAKVTLADFEETLEIFISVGWRLPQEPSSFLAAGVLDVTRVADAARQAGSLALATPDSAIADAWAVYTSNARLLEDYVPTPVPGLAPALLRCTGGEGDRGGPEPSVPKPGRATADWAGVADPARVDEVPVYHFAVMEAPNDRAVAAWLAATAVQPRGTTT